MVRHIPSASPLRAGGNYGTAAEAATHDAAAVWGMPDFVFLPEQAEVGSGTRELGDGILLVERRGVVLQVKGREVPPGSTDRERRWLEKKSEHALNQASGSIRRLLMEPRELTNLRGTTVRVDASDYRWMSVVVLDHPDPPDDLQLSLHAAKHPAVILLRRDWEFLFDQLKSTYAVCEYLERVAGEPTVLGQESVRYYKRAQADAQTTPKGLAPALIGLGEHVARPLLPQEPAAHSDRRAHQMVRSVMEDVATMPAQSISEEQRLQLLGQLDRLPVAHRATFGEHLVDAMKAVSAEVTTDLVWRMKTLRGGAGSPQLGYVACNHPHSRSVGDAFITWAQLRHHEMYAITGETELMTVGVLLTPPRGGAGPWDTTIAAVLGASHFTAEDLRALRELWPGEKQASHSGRQDDRRRVPLLGAAERTGGAFRRVT